MQAIRLIQVVLVQDPKNPLADEASLALLGAFLELEDYPSVVSSGGPIRPALPKEQLPGQLPVQRGPGRFPPWPIRPGHRGGRGHRVGDLPRRRRGRAPSPNKWQALFILGQIHDARQQPLQALTYYKRVADRFSDAAASVTALTRKELSIPEITLVRALAGPKIAEGSGLRAMAPDAFVAPKSRRDVRERPEIVLDSRNIDAVDIKVYPVDLMRLYLARRSLDQVSGIDLAGITPLYETTVKLGSDDASANLGDDRARIIPLPLTKKGAYLAMVRGDDLYASGIVLLTPLMLDVLEEPGGSPGRVRIQVRDASTGTPLSKVQVKVIGVGNTDFISRTTDLRGVATAEGLVGPITAVARLGVAQFAFYRGITPLSPAPPGATAAADKPAAMPPAEPEALNKNLMDLNTSNQLRQIQQLDERQGAENPNAAPAGRFR